MMSSVILALLAILVALVCIPIVTALWMGDPADRDW